MVGDQICNRGEGDKTLCRPKGMVGGVERKKKGTRKKKKGEKKKERAFEEHKVLS